MKKNSPQDNKQEKQPENKPAAEKQQATVSYLVFRMAERHFALPSSAVIEVVEPQVVTPLPFVPSYLDGLIHVEGQVLPQLDLQGCLGGPITDPNDFSGEVIVLGTEHASCAMRIDRVLEKIDMPTNAVNKLNKSTDPVVERKGKTTTKQSPDTEKKFKTSEKVTAISNKSSGRDVAIGEFQWNKNTVLLLNSEALNALVGAKEMTKGRKGIIGSADDTQEDSQQNTLTCLVVNVGQEEYAILLSEVLEIIAVDHVTSVPGATVPISGIAKVRKDPVLLLSLAQMLRSAATQTESGTNQESDSNLMVLVQPDETRYGLCVDSIRGIEHFAAESIRHVEDERSDLSGVIVGDAERIIGLIEPAHLFSSQRRQDFAPFVPETRARVDEVEEETVSLLHILIGDESFGIPLHMVKRISEFREPEPVKSKPGSLLQGAVEIEGMVLPVLDVSNEVGQEDVPADGGFVVVAKENSEWAIRVTQANRIIELPTSKVDSFVEGDTDMINGVANFDNQLVSILAIDQIVRRAS